MVPPSPTLYRTQDSPMVRKRLSVITSSTMRSDGTFDLPTPTSMPDSPASSIMSDWHQLHTPNKYSPHSPTVMITDAASRGLGMHNNGSHNSMDHTRMMADPKGMLSPKMNSPRSPRTVINRNATNARQQSAMLAQNVNFDQESIASSYQQRDMSRRSSAASEKKIESAMASRMRQEYGLNHTAMSMADPHFAQWILYSGRPNSNQDEEYDGRPMSSLQHDDEQVINFMEPSSSKDSQGNGKNKRSPLNGFTGLVRKATGRLALNSSIFRSKGDADDQYLDHEFDFGPESTEHHAINFDELYGEINDEAFGMNHYSATKQHDQLPEIRRSPKLTVTSPLETGGSPVLNNYTIEEEDEGDYEDPSQMAFYTEAEAKHGNPNELMPPQRLRRYVSKETIASVYRIIESYQKEDNPTPDNCPALPPPVERSRTNSSGELPDLGALELHQLGGRRSKSSLPPKPSRATQLLTSLSHLQTEIANQPSSPTYDQQSLNRRKSSKSAASQKQSIINMQRSPTVESGSGYSTFVDVFCDYRDAWLGEEEEELEHLEEERVKALYNLIATEKKFVRTLQLIRNAFIEPLRLNAAKSNRFIHRSYTKDEITGIFGGIEQLLPRHEKLLRDLEQSALDRKQTGIMENAISAFTQNCRWLRLHMDYLRQYPQMLFDLVQLQKRSTLFRRALKVSMAII
ncbi:hypothetical protein BDF19DRAFT_196925 [Syncephalis fuscata]|nr:hypothetical protein BDF19DRAFT_196925 [Syncephalis fuscata]